MKASLRLLRRKNVYSSCNSTSRYYIGRFGNYYGLNGKLSNYCNKTVRSSQCNDSYYCNRLSEKTYLSIYDTVQGYRRVGLLVKQCMCRRLKRFCGIRCLFNLISPIKNTYLNKRRSYQVTPKQTSSKGLCFPSFARFVELFLNYKLYLYGHKVILSGERCL